MEFIITQHDDEKRGYFKTKFGDQKAGIMTYTWAGEDKFIIDHTEVYTEFEGQGIGKKMVLQAVEFARNNNYKIIPLCPFAKLVFGRLPEIHDVLISNN